MADARAELLEVSGPADRWRALGLTVMADGTIPFLFASLAVTDATDRDGIVGWAISGIDPDVTDIDGLPTRVVDARVPTLADHPNGAVEVDHVVVTTGSLERTSDAITAATGCELRRVRDLGHSRQGFHRLGRGGLIVEIVERPEIDDSHASFWGLVLNVGDLDAALTLLGPDLVGEAKDAVQPGRRIATVRREAGLAMPLALMSLPGSS